MFCGFTVFANTERFLNRFSFRDKNGDELSKAVEIVFLEMSKLKKALEKPICELTGLEQWALFFKYAGEPEFQEKLKKITDQREGIKVAADLLSNISKNEEERARFRSRRMILMDMTTNMNAAKKEGRLEGREEGRLEGREEGREEIKREIALNMLASGLPLEQIAKFTNLTVEEIKNF
jgi:predicted transposase/invertase (TIGR01784 family)